MRYVCGVCGYVYDEEKEGVPFSELPEDWRCPLCKAPKSEFRAEGEQTAAVATPALKTDEDFKKLSVGQMAALCTNLARGCEKQYKQEESQLFTDLAAYFSKVVPEQTDAGIEELASLLQADIDQYPGIRTVVDQNKDRGAARALVWGEKVSRMLSSLVNRYLKDGEELLKDTEIWVCTACGFVYIGDTPPERCPVCRVPAEKFEKIEGRKAS
ncbi:MAG: rubredoxin [Coriobacteriales bacterium]|nr:rubredoxin [Coriobacteriales bacterium]